MNRHRTLVVLVLALFVVLRVPGLSTSYYQDEFKSVVVSETSFAAASAFLTHPPLTAVFLRLDALVFGGYGMRMLPMLCSIVSLLLLYIVVRRRFDEHTALWSMLLYAISFYSVWASLMVDTDGAILPVLFLASVYCYDRARDDTRRRRLWIGLLVLVLGTGMLVKLSFVLVLGALLLDFSIAHRRSLHSSYRTVASIVLGGLVTLTILLMSIRVLYPAFQLEGMVEHARAYMHLGDRNYLQILVQGVKAVYYLSPLLLVPLIFLSRDMYTKARVFVVYLIASLIFYFVLFDFSRGALDKYLMVTIVPLCVLSGAVLRRSVTRSALRSPWGSGLGLLAAGAVILSSFLPQMVVPLYPKSAWFLSVLHGHLNILTPFNGGSGPLGFYVSFLPIVLGYAVSLIAGGVAFITPRFREIAVVSMLFVGVAYCAVFIEEFSLGMINGSTATVLTESLTFIEQSPRVTSIITYNDVGAYELTKMGKYAGRFYAVPQFEEGHTKLFAAHTGQFLVVGIPPLYEGFYSQYFAACATLFQTRSGSILSTIYSCNKAK